MKLIGLMEQLIIIVLSDVHLTNSSPVGRKDDVFNVGFKKLKFVFDWAKKNKVHIILQAGDLFDSVRNWNCLYGFANMMRDFKGKFLTVYGQHNMYYRNTNFVNSLKLLDVVIDNFHILGKNPYKWSYLGDKINIYGCSYGDDVKKINFDPAADFSILVIHAPISDKYVNYDHMKADRFLRDNKEYDLILCGDIHREFCLRDDEDRVIVNTGCMLRLDADEYNFKYEPKFCVFDIENRKMEWITIPHASAEEVLTRSHINVKEDGKENEMIREFVKSIKDNEQFGVDFIKNLDAVIKEDAVPERVIRLISEKMAMTDKR